MVFCWKSLEFSREFGSLSVANVCFVGSKASNSLENLKTASAGSSSCAVTPIGLGGSKSTCFYPFCRCVRQHLSPSCHPCHPPKRVQTPCASAFCHPDTLKHEILSICISRCVQTIANKGEKMRCFRTQNGCVRTQHLDLRQKNVLFSRILRRIHCQSGKSPYLCIVKRK